jgi:hypothetical protein
VSAEWAAVLEVGPPGADHGQGGRLALDPALGVKVMSSDRSASGGHSLKPTSTG